jgi:hypothetical protein
MDKQTSESDSEPEVVSEAKLDSEEDAKELVWKRPHTSHPTEQVIKLTNYA